MSSLPFWMSGLNNIPGGRTNEGNPTSNAYIMFGLAFGDASPTYILRILFSRQSEAAFFVWDWHKSKFLAIGMDHNQYHTDRPNSQSQNNQPNREG